MKSVLQKNFDETRERLEQSGSDWVYGAVITDLAAIPVTVRLQYLPQGVLQFNHLMDTNGCASRGPLNILETKLDYFWDHGMHPNLQKWFDENGYRVNNRFALCDAFIEILSGTTPNGNSMKAPVDTIYKYGVIPAALIPLEPDMTWEQYMNRARVTKVHTDLGKEFLRRLIFNYEQVPLSRFNEALQDDLLDVAVHGWPDPVNGVYPRTDGQFNHVVAGLNDEIDIFDNYDPFVKRLAKDYKFFDWGYSFSITSQNPFPDETVTIFETLQKYGLLAFFSKCMDLLRSVKAAPAIPTVTPSAPKLPDPTPLPETSSERLAEAAKNMLGLDASPKNLAPQELSCAEAVSNICHSVWPDFPAEILSTVTLYATLQASPHFKEVSDPLIGCVVVSPTMGDNHGHTGIYTEPDQIASNDSRDGKFRENYSRETWRSYFGTHKGLRGHLFQPVDNV